MAWRTRRPKTAPVVFLFVPSPTAARNANAGETSHRTRRAGVVLQGTRRGCFEGKPKGSPHFRDSLETNPSKPLGGAPTPGGARSTGPSTALLAHSLLWVPPT